MCRYDSTCCVYTGSDIIPAHARDPPFLPLPVQNTHISFTIILLIEKMSFVLNGAKLGLAINES